MTYEQVLTYIDSAIWHGSRLGLSRTRELLERLGNPQDKLRFVHIAGTNGKGSTSAMLSFVLQQAGYRVGLYISPFVNVFSERMQVNNEPIGDDALVEIAIEVAAQAEQMTDKPTEFELITAIAMCFFVRSRCDIVILEVGLGGRLDSTNVIKTPLVAVITAMGFDHQKQLGNTMREIATEKAGIIKEGGDVVVYGANPEAEAVFAVVCRARSARLRQPDFGALTPLSLTLKGQTFRYMGETYSLSLLGCYQPRNAAVALTVLDVLREKGFAIPTEAVHEGLARTRWPARFEVLHEKPAVIVDGGHNPEGVEGTVDSLCALFPDQKIHFVVGMMADKDAKTMLSELTPLAAAWYTVRPNCPRALPAADLAKLLSDLPIPVTVADTVEEGVRLAMQDAGPDGVVCAVGSLYMSGTIRAMFA
ncbi:MAG: bifunctional folylpolyglutamate synthase/dihydrofolate synthase [Clostridiales bacterium]|nr:bifunctional folylpolyglutamate synthase/dihydrofolate synthase [Clostridiales bacterium]